MKIKLNDAKYLLQDTIFLTIVKAVRDDQVEVFTRSRADQAGLREEAHAMLRALDKLTAKLQSVIDDEAMKERLKRDEARRTL